MGYEHTQKGPWCYLLFAIAAFCFVSSWTLRDEILAVSVCLGVAVVMSICGFSFAHLKVADEADALAVRFGPLPLFSTRIRYSDIRHVELDRTRLIDGFGVHWIPGRGTTYNIWGFACVKLDLAKKTLRIGTDDAETLIQFLRDRT